MADSPRREPRFVYLSDAPEPRARVRQESTRYGWRLDAANHRPLGRAAGVSDSVESCRESATSVRERLAELATVITPDTSHAVWTWRLELERKPVAVSAHSYMRRVECVRAYGQFVAALASADPADGVVRNFGPRALRAFDVAAEVNL